MGSRISTDLGDPRLLKLLKLEAQESDTTIKEVLVKALEGYFNHRLELKAMLTLSDKVFEEWNNPKDSEYDNI